MSTSSRSPDDQSKSRNTLRLANVSWQKWVLSVTQFGPASRISAGCLRTSGREKYPRRARNPKLTPQCGVVKSGCFENRPGITHSERPGDSRPATARGTSEQAKADAPIAMNSLLFIVTQT